jgi:hypothetical protein
MIKFSREGVSFSYYGDTVLRKWPWVSGARYRSSIHACDFNSLQRYWWMVGSLEAKLLERPGSEKNVIGARFYEIFAEYCKFKFPKQYVVVLYDIDSSQKDSAFWSRLPHKSAVAFAKDAVFLICKNRNQMLSITYNTNTMFATALAIEAGVLVDCNQWQDSPEE